MLGTILFFGPWMFVAALLLSLTTGVRSINAVLLLLPLGAGAILIAAAGLAIGAAGGAQTSMLPFVLAHGVVMLAATVLSVGVSARRLRNA